MNDIVGVFQMPQEEDWGLRFRRVIGTESFEMDIIKSQAVSLYQWFILGWHITISFKANAQIYCKLVAICYASLVI